MSQAQHRNRETPCAVPVAWLPGSPIITSQVPIDRWYEIVGNPTLADAILDRIMHNSHRIELKGESLRKQRAAG